MREKAKDVNDEKRGEMIERQKSVTPTQKEDKDKRYEDKERKREMQGGRVHTTWLI